MIRTRSATRRSSQALCVYVCVAVGVGDPTFVFGGPPSPPPRAPGAAARHVASSSHLPLGASDPKTFHRSAVDLEGALTLRFQDVSIPARGWALALARTYRSHGATTELGRDWSWSFGPRIEIEATSREPEVIEEDGRVNRYTAAGADLFVPRSASFGHVLRTFPDGTFARIYSEGSVERFDHRGLLCERDDAFGVAQRIERDGELPSRVVAAGGRTLRFEYTWGRLAAATDPLGRRTTYDYDDAGRLAAVVDPLGRRTQLRYDAAGRLATLTFADGSTLEASYDERGRVTRLAGPGPVVTHFAHEEGIRGGTRVIACTDSTGATERVELEQKEGGATLRYVNPAGEVTVVEARAGEITIDNGRGAPARLELDTAGLPCVFVGHEGRSLPSTARPTSPPPATPGYDEAGQATELALRGERLVPTYDAAGRLTRLTHPGGAAETFLYDAGDRLLRRGDVLGRSETFEYDAADRLIRATDFRGNVTTYRWDARGLLVACARPPAPEVVLAYDAAGWLTRVARGGRAVALEHDSAHRVVAISDECGNRETLEYDSAGALAAVVDRRGRRLTFEPDADGVPRRMSEDGAPALTFTSLMGTEAVTIGGPIGSEEVERSSGIVRSFLTSPLGRSSEDARRDDGRPLERRRPGLAKETWQYDSLGRPVAHGFSGEPGTRSHYAPDGRLASLEERSGLVWTFERDALGRVSRARSSKGDVRAYEYDALGDVRAVVSEHGSRIEYDYDQRGRVSVVRDASGATRYGYDDLGRLATIDEPGGAHTSSSYDARGLLVEVVERRGDSEQHTRHEYDRFGSVTRTIHPDGREETFAYDRAGRLATHVDAGVLTKLAYDSLGRLVRTELGAVVETREYDADGRLVAVGGAHPRRYSYAAGDAPIATEDARGKVWREDRDPFGQVIARTTPTGATTRYERSETGEVVAVIDPAGRKLAFGRDAVSRVVSSQLPGGTAEVFAYDPRGDLVSVRRPSGAEIRYERDDAGRVRTVSEDGKVVETFGYDPRGRLVSVEDAIGRSTFAYDDRGRLTRSTDGFGRTLAYTYDASGNLSELVGPSGEKTQWSYKSGRVASVTGPDGKTTSLERDDTGRIATVLYPGGTRATLAYGADGRLSALRSLAENGDLRAERALERDGAGNVVAASGGGRRTTYAYDDAGRLVATRSGADSELYSYDLSGNLTRLGGDAIEHDAAGRVRRVGEHAVTYDRDGNLTKIDGVVSFAYDVFGRLVGATRAGSEPVAFRYDYLGRRVETTSGGHVTRYLYDRGEVVAAYAADGSRLAWLERAGDGPGSARLHDSKGAALLLADGLGTPLLLATPDGEVTHYEISPWGRPITRGPPELMGFSGAPHDAAAGVVFLGRRAYLPEIGRFLTPDPSLQGATVPEVREPATLEGNLAPYTYANGNPLRFTDRSGLEPEETGPNATPKTPEPAAPRAPEPEGLPGEPVTAPAQGTGGGGTRTTLPVDQIKYSQNGVQSTTSDGKSIDQLATDFKRGGYDPSKPPIDVVRNADGSYTTIDNRRLRAADAAQLKEIPVEIHNFDDPVPRSRVDGKGLSEDAARRLNNRGIERSDGARWVEGEFPDTWGDFVHSRAQSQNGAFPYEGTKTLPKINGPVTGAGDVDPGVVDKLREPTSRTYQEPKTPAADPGGIGPPVEPPRAPVPEAPSPGGDVGPRAGGEPVRPSPGVDVPGEIGGGGSKSSAIAELFSIPEWLGGLLDALAVVGAAALAFQEYQLWQRYENAAAQHNPAERLIDLGRFVGDTVANVGLFLLPFLGPEGILAFFVLSLLWKWFNTDPTFLTGCEVRPPGLSRSERQEIAPGSRPAVATLWLDRPASVRASVHKPDGALVRDLGRTQGGSGILRVFWDGTGADDEPVADGEYHLLVHDARDDAGPLGLAPTRAIVVVNGALADAASPVASTPRDPKAPAAEKGSLVGDVRVTRTTSLVAVDRGFATFDRAQAWLSGPTPAASETVGAWRWSDGAHASEGEGSDIHYVVAPSAGWFLGAGDNLVQYLRVDPAAPPREVLLQLYGEGLDPEHRVFFGESLVDLGAAEGPGLRRLGPVPPGGAWLRLRIPAEHLGLTGRHVTGVLFATYGGRALWGKTTTSSRADSASSVVPANATEKDSTPIGHLAVLYDVLVPGRLAIELVGADGAARMLRDDVVGCGRRTLSWDGPAPLVLGSARLRFRLAREGSPPEQTIDLAPLTTEASALVARIDFPPSGTIGRATVPIFGQAGGTHFQRSVVDYRPVSAPETAPWTELAHSTVPSLISPDDFDRIVSASMEGALRATIHGNLASLEAGSFAHRYEFRPEATPIPPDRLVVRLRVFGADGAVAEDRVDLLVGEVANNRSLSRVPSADGRASLELDPLSLPFPGAALAIETVALPPVGDDHVARGPAYRVAPESLVFAHAGRLTLAAEKRDRTAIYRHTRAGWEPLETVERRDDAIVATLERIPPGAVFAVLEQVREREPVLYALPGSVGIAERALLGAEPASPAIETTGAPAPPLPRPSGATPFVETHGLRRFGALPGGRSDPEILVRGPFELAAAPLLSFALRPAPHTVAQLIVRRGSRTDVLPLCGPGPGDDGEWRRASFPIAALLGATRGRVDEIAIGRVTAGGWRETALSGLSGAASIEVDDLWLGPEWPPTGARELDLVYPDAGVTAIAWSVDTAAVATPTTVVAGKPSRIALPALPSGLHFLHVRGASGDSWGSVAHWPLLVDTDAPRALEPWPAASSESGELRARIRIEDEGTGVDPATIRFELGRVPVPPAAVSFDPATGVAGFAFGDVPQRPRFEIGDAVEVALVAVSDRARNALAKPVRWSWRFDPHRLAVGIAHPLTRDGGSDPAWSPDGSRLAFVADGEDGGDVFEVEVASGKVTRLTHGARATGSPGYSPDGTRIVFARENGVAIADRAGGAVTALAETGTGPSWLDATTILLARGDAVLAVSVPGGRERTVVTAEPGGSAKRPRASGQKLAFGVSIYNESIWLQEAPGRQPRAISRDLSEPALVEQDAALSADGQWVAFAAGGTAPGLWLARPDGSERTALLAAAAGGDRRPVWSPDGTRIAFDTDRNGLRNVWLLELGKPPAVSVVPQVISYAVKTPVAIKLQLERESTTRVLVTTAEGREVRELRARSVAAKGPLELTWDGLGSAGERLAGRRYAVSVEVQADGPALRVSVPIALDNEPPVTRVFRSSDGREVGPWTPPGDDDSIALEGDDGVDGVGVQRTEVLGEDATTWHEVTGPLEGRAIASGVLTYRSVDRFGQTEAAKRLELRRSSAGALPRVADVVKVAEPKRVGSWVCLGVGLALLLIVAVVAFVLRARRRTPRE